MASNFRVVNLTSGFTFKRKHVDRAIDNCAVTWVEYGVSVRNLTIAESIQARNEQARLQEPLPYAEVHGLRFDPPASGITATRREGLLMWAAHDFLKNVAA